MESDILHRPRSLYRPGTIFLEMQLFYRRYFWKYKDFNPRFKGQKGEKYKWINIL